jgi:hypothetical protein
MLPVSSVSALGMPAPMQKRGTSSAVWIVKSRWRMFLRVGA